MPLVATDSVIVHAFRYSEASKIVRLMTRDHGLQSAIAKGALSAKSRFGGKLQVLSQGIARFNFRAHRDLHTLQEFEVSVQRPQLAKDVHRFTAGSAVCELILRFAPAAPHLEVFEQLVRTLDGLVQASEEELAAFALSALWTTVAGLGFEPSLGQCARDGAPLEAGAGKFSVREGGFLCKPCARGASVRTLTGADRMQLELLVAGRPHEVGSLTLRHAAAHRRLLSEFIAQHVAEGKELQALPIWETVS